MFNRVGSILLGFAMSAAMPLSAAESEAVPVVIRGAEQLAPVTPYRTLPLSELPPARAWRPGDPIREIPIRRTDPATVQIPNRPTRPDALVGRQGEPLRGGAAALSPIGRNFAGPVSGSNPPDTNADVGPNNYVHTINAAGGTLVTIFDKAFPVPNQLTQILLNTAAPPMTPCAAGGSGDPVVSYDRQADRWLLVEFTQAGNGLCVYVSTGPNPAGAYNLFQLNTGVLPDYPKVGVWPTDENGGQGSYVITTNENALNPPVSGVYALSRNAMLNGTAFAPQRLSIPRLSGFNFWSTTPADPDGANPPPTGAGAIVMFHRDTENHDGPDPDDVDLLEIWRFDVDWLNPVNTALVQEPAIQVAEFDSKLCGLSGFNCIEQPGTGVTLIPLREVIMHQLQYMNRGNFESLVGNFVVDSGGDVAGIRWFELRRSGGSNWTLVQEGTHRPDDDSRWLGSISMSKNGVIALGYNVSSSNTFFGLRMTGTFLSNGTMTDPEQVIVGGTVASASNRVGDYAAMQLDPYDDCTFWFTGEVLNGANWGTQVTTFRDDFGPDLDTDGFIDSCDNCPIDGNAAQADADGDRVGDVCDNCPNDANADQSDVDLDGTGNSCDNCPARFNVSQADDDGDGTGEICDNCPGLANENQSDLDGDGFGDLCDICPLAADPDQTDTDFDGEGDACDLDDDNDGIVDVADNCRLVVNPGQSDSDGDDVGDACDNCPSDVNPNQNDTDADCPDPLTGSDCGDVCDLCTDSDGDNYGDPGLPNPECLDDNCPTVFNPAQDDTNGDGTIDNDDLQRDSDGDGVGNSCDNCPFLSNPNQFDSDFDGIGDGCDADPQCPVGCEWIMDPSGGSPGGVCDGCSIFPVFQIGLIQDCLGFPAAIGFDSSLCIGSVIKPSDAPCPPWLAAVDACCPGGGLCPGADFRLFAMDAFGEIVLPFDSYGLAPDSGFGYAAIFGEDLDADGLRDSVVGAPGAAGDGKVLFLSSTDGLLLDEVAGLNGERFGSSLALHKDGVLIGAPLGGPPNRGGGSVGRVSLYEPTTGESLAEFFGSLPGGEFGSAVVVLDDIDGDNKLDLAVGAPGSGNDGSGAGYVRLLSRNGEQLLQRSGIAAKERYGAAMDRCDLDGDGQLDIVVGAPDAATAAGPKSGRIEVFDTSGNVLLSIDGSWKGGGFGSAISCGPDADGDGRADLLVGAPLANTQHASDAGLVLLYNSTGQLLAAYAGENSGDHLGRYVELAPDLNGDGRADLVMSSPIDDDDNLGRTAYVMSTLDGDGDGIDVETDNCPSIGNPSQKDRDGDGVGDVCDLCPSTPDPLQANTDGDPRGDACDCAPNQAGTYQGAAEVADGIDNQCPGEPGYGAIDELAPDLRLDRNGGAIAINWSGLSGATIYQLARSPLANLAGSCASSWHDQPSATDNETPAPGVTTYLLVRTAGPESGTWGTTGNGGMRHPQCP